LVTSFIHIEHICTFFVTFFSATIDGRGLIFGHKLHIGTPYRGKRSTAADDKHGPSNIVEKWLKVSKSKNQSMIQLLLGFSQLNQILYKTR
jgi:hypothetical protein